MDDFESRSDQWLNLMVFSNSGLTVVWDEFWCYGAGSVNDDDDDTNSHVTMSLFSLLRVLDLNLLASRLWSNCWGATCAGSFWKTAPQTRWTTTGPHAFTWPLVTAIVTSSGMRLSRRIVLKHYMMMVIGMMGMIDDHYDGDVISEQ